MTTTAKSSDMFWFLVQEHNKQQKQELLVQSIDRLTWATNVASQMMM